MSPKSRCGTSPNSGHAATTNGLGWCAVCSRIVEQPLNDRVMHAIAVHSFFTNDSLGLGLDGLVYGLVLCDRRSRPALRSILDIFNKIVQLSDPCNLAVFADVDAVEEHPDNSEARCQVQIRFKR